MDSPGSDTPAGGFGEFKKRARSILWRQDPGAKTDEQKTTYNAWAVRVESLEKNVGRSHREAIVEASKEFPCLHRLFRECDVSMYDRDPTKFPEIQHGTKPKVKVKSEGKEQTYRENLNWAIFSAGRFLRTGDLPRVCPNDVAYYLFMQAKEEPKDFLSRFNQMEAKSTDSEENRRTEKVAKRSVDELNSMLEVLDEEE